MSWDKEINLNTAPEKLVLREEKGGAKRIILRLIKKSNDLHIVHYISAPGDISVWLMVQLTDQQEATITYEQIIQTDQVNSKVYAKGVISGQARLHFDSEVQVEEQHPNVKLHSEKRFIVLDGGRVFSKPEFKSLYKGIKAIHALTISSLDENHLYYLQSRGMSYNSAKQLLTELL